MAGLLGLLNLGASAFQAQNAGVATAGKNIANLNTPGYVRESVDLASVASGSLLGGVVAGDPTRQDSPLLSSRERLAAGSSGMADAQAAALDGLEGDLSGQGTDVAQAVGNFFGAAAKLSASPAEESLRQSLIEKAKALAATLEKAAHAVATAQAEANKRIAEQAAEATKLAKQVANANKTLGGGGGDPVVADQRDQDAKKLAELMGGQARIDADGQMRVTVGGGAVLVDGDRAASVQTAGDPNDPTSVKVQIVDGSHTDDVTARLDGGEIAGELAFRDGSAKQAGDDLDNLAYDLATQINGVHAQNAGLDGKTGRNLFVQPGGRTGAAAAMAIDPTVDADHSLLATAAPGEGQTGTGGIQALVALGDAKVAGSGASKRSFADEGIRLIGAVGSAASSAKITKTAESAKVESLASLRDSLSGVSQEDELTKLVGFQHAAQAATTFLSTVNSLLDDLIAKL